MKKKILSLALALALCLGLTVPAFAARTYTVDDIIITASSDGTISFTGAGVLTELHMEVGYELFMAATERKVKTAKINIGANITYDEDWLAEVKDFYSYNDLSVVISNSSAPPTPTVGGFTDVKESDYFADPVVWAVGKKITAGTSATTFSPNQNCTVAQILSFLYRAYGSPSPKKSNPFSDVKSSDYYYNAARWAYEKGMVTGSTFGGDRPCTRSMAVTYMWQAAGGASGEFNINSHGVLNGYSGNGGDVVIPSGVTNIAAGFIENKSLTSVTIPVSVTEIDDLAFFDSSLTDIYYEGSQAQWDAITVGYNTGGDWAFMDLYDSAFMDIEPTVHYNSKMPQQDQQSTDTGFTDVSSTADYAQAVAWAVEKGVTSGTTATTFSPDSVCTRGQIVTFLHRALA